MSFSPSSKYRPFPPVVLPDRSWPDRVHTRAPIWCSVDLRDGNQALAQPMSVEEKLEYFDLLVATGFKQIEIGFPSASQIEFDFCRRLIEENRVPADVSLQILCQCREDLIVRSLDALRGAKNIIFHLYNSTSPKQRQYVFGASRDDIKAIAVRGIGWLKQHMGPLIANGSRIRLEYSPESFTSTELDFALEICEAVTDVWQPTADNKIILNLPATVEYTTPNVHADQIEWMCRHLFRRALTEVSLHTHNDRGTGVAATELGLLAGADRVEGTLFGNGERTGNLDVVTVALNLHTHGIETGLDFSNLTHIREVYERTTRMEVPPRQPYAGDLVFTAFSGSHQDAIKKSWPHQKPGHPWDVIYIPIDPADIGRTYKAIIRINSQSGKGGVAYILETEFGYQLPKLMHKEIGKVINDLADRNGTELSPAEIHAAFQQEYIERATPALVLREFRTTERGAQVTSEAELIVRDAPAPLRFAGTGNGPIDAFVRGLAATGRVPAFDVQSYNEHSLGSGAEARAVSYIQIKLADGRTLFGAGVDTNIELASIRAIVSALNRALA
jgi:2-isopropylmalate synthase